MLADGRGGGGDKGRLPDIEFGPDFQAVLCADIVGYSRLMEIDSVDTYRRFRSLRVSVIDPLIVSYRGTVVKNTGDGFICVFEVARDAVRCALDLHEAVAAAQPDTPAGRSMLFRAGLHWGRVIYDHDDVFGHVINVATRLQELAPPAGTVVSRDFLRSADPGAGFTTTDLGAVRLKNLAEPIAAALLGEAGRLHGATPSGTASEGSVPSIALLPFQDLTGRGETSHIARGFVDDIIASLSNLREIFTVANGSTVGIVPAQTTTDEIVERLGVQYLFSGSIRRLRKSWRLAVELTDATSGEVVWAEKYEVGADEIFDLQDEITFTIVRQIASHVQTQLVRKAMRKPPQSLTAYDYFLRAQDLIYQLNQDNFQSAKTLLHNAIREDPTYGAPFALLSLWHMFSVAEGWSTAPGSDAEQVLNHAQSAIERDQNNALAHALLGQAQGLFGHGIETAKASVDRARAISPNSAWAWTLSSGPYGFAGETGTAIRMAERGLRLSPIDQHAFFMQGLLAQSHYLHGNHVEAVTWARRSLAANPRFGNAVRVLVASLQALGRNDEAAEMVNFHNQIAPRFLLSDYEKRCPFTPEHAEIYVDRLKRAGVK